MYVKPPESLNWPPSMINWLRNKKKRKDEEILQIFEELLVHLDSSHESAYSGLAPEQLSVLIRRERDNLKSGDRVDYIKLKGLFGPTGPIQEISIDNGWGDSFLLLAARFDSAALFRT